MPLRLDEIVARLGGDLSGDGSVRVTTIATLDAAGPDDLTFLSNPKYRARLASTRAAAVIVAPDSAADCPTAAIVTAQPYLYFARVAQWLHPRPRPAVGIHSSAVVDGSIAASASIGANVHIGVDAVIGDDVVIEANCSIGAGCSIGEGSWLHAGVHVYDSCSIGARAIIHSGVVIGADGFGFAREHDGSWVKIPQTGRVVIGDDVEIGANTTIDRGALDDTVIGDGVKLDNQIQIGHNCRIGEHTAMAGFSGVAGSTDVGRHCTIGAGALILGHLSICDHADVSAGTVISRSIRKPGTYTGMFPADDNDSWARNTAVVRHLAELVERVRSLEKRIKDKGKEKGNG